MGRIFKSNMDYDFVSNTIKHQDCLHEKPVVAYKNGGLDIWTPCTKEATNIILENADDNLRNAISDITVCSYTDGITDARDFLTPVRVAEWIISFGVGWALSRILK